VAATRVASLKTTTGQNMNISLIGVNATVINSCATAVNGLVQHTVALVWQAI